MYSSVPTELRGTLRTTAPKRFKRDCEDIIDLPQYHHTHRHVNVSVRHVEPGTRYRENSGILEDRSDVINVMISLGIIIIIIIIIKILKYKDLTIDIQHMWNVKTRVIPVIIRATGTTSKSFRKCVSDIPGNHDVKELQKTAILGTAHILRKVLT